MRRPQEQGSREAESIHPQAFGIEDLVEQGPFGRTTLFNAIKCGALKAKKYGRRTVVLDPDWRSFLANLPDARAA